MNEKYEIEPIGFFKTDADEKYAVSRQPSVIKGNRGKIVLNAGCHFEEALKDLEGFDRIFVLYRFHKNSSWKPKVMPPRGDQKRGLFATRSPHRPNFLGLSCIELTSIEGLVLNVVNHDLLDGTPIFDIKPYLVYADCFPDAKQGWLDSVGDEQMFLIKWQGIATEKLNFLESNGGIAFALNIEPRLTVCPFPKKQNRIRLLKDGLYEIAYKTWRVSFSLDLEHHVVIIQDVYSGYDKETLEGRKACPYDDLELHLQFNKIFQLI